MYLLFMKYKVREFSFKTFPGRHHYNIFFLAGEARQENTTKFS